MRSILILAEERYFTVRFIDDDDDVIIVVITTTHTSSLHEVNKMV
jgi:hypothetical protein